MKPTNRQPLDNQCLKRRIINELREFAKGKSRAKFRRELYQEAQWYQIFIAARAEALLRSLSTAKGIRPDKRTRWLFEQIELEIYR